MSKTPLGNVPLANRPIRLTLRDTPRFERSTRKPSFRSFHQERARAWPDRAAWVASLRAACRWLTDVSMVRTDTLPKAQNPYDYDYASWRGAVREYDTRHGQWLVFGPVWHTGQAVKALAMAGRLLGDQALIQAAIDAAGFVRRAQINDPSDPDDGAVFAQENANRDVSATSCMLESLDGLIHLAEVTSDPTWWDAVLRCVRWAHRRLFLAQEGLFLDDFLIADRSPRSSPNTLLHGVPGRPLIDDAIFLKASIHAHDDALARAFYTTAERLLAEEEPAGNWINFPPCDSVAGLVHPRQGYWWGRPMIAAWKHSGDQRYLACALRVAEWYRQAQRLDGGMFRMTDRHFRTSTHDDATSGVLCAALVWLDLILAGHGQAHLHPLRHALAYGYRMQFGQTSDPNLAGAILEKILAPDGTDRPNFAVRDLGTIFYIQAVVSMLDQGLERTLGHAH